MNPYFEQMVLSASPVELIRILYQRGIGSLRDAREHLKNGRIQQRCASINNAYAVLTELTSSLRADDAPELTAKLNGLYGYMQGRLVDANLNQSDEPLTEVIGLLTILAEAWNAVPDPYIAEAASVNPWGAGAGSRECQGDLRAAISA